MPTFLIFRSGSVIETIQGANVPKLTSAIENAVRLSGASKPTYSSVGRKLGGDPIQGHSFSRRWNVKGMMDTLYTFFGLYFWSLFSLDAYLAAENSPFNTGRVAAAPPAMKGGRTGAATQVGKKLGTIADITGGN